MFNLWLNLWNIFPDISWHIQFHVYLAHCLPCISYAPVGSLPNYRCISSGFAWRSCSLISKIRVNAVTYKELEILRVWIMNLVVLANGLFYWVLAEIGKKSNSSDSEILNSTNSLLKHDLALVNCSTKCNQSKNPGLYKFNSSDLAKHKIVSL